MEENKKREELIAALLRLLEAAGTADIKTIYIFALNLV